MHYAFLDLRTNSIESVWVSNGKMMTWLNRHMMMPYILPMLLKKSLGARMEMIVLRFTQSDMEHIRSELGGSDGMRLDLRLHCGLSVTANRQLRVIKGCIHQNESGHLSEEPQHDIQ